MASALLHLHHLWGYEIDWGAIPTWFGAILTGGSLLLGFNILRNDRKKAVRSQADKVVTWIAEGSDSTTDPPTGNYKVTVWNTSRGPIVRVIIFERSREDEPPHRGVKAIRHRLTTRGHASKPGEAGGKNLHILYGTYFTTAPHPFELDPGQKFECVIPRRDQSAMFLVFTDGDGHNWIRDIGTTQLISVGHFKYGVLNPFTITFDFSKIKIRREP